MRSGTALVWETDEPLCSPVETVEVDRTTPGRFCGDTEDLCEVPGESRKWEVRGGVVVARVDVLL